MILRELRRRLFWKILLACLLIAVTGTCVLVAATPFTMLRSYENHRGMMGGMMDEHGGPGQGGGMSPCGGGITYRNFSTAAFEAVRLAVLAAMVAAVGVSVFTSYQLVTPVRRMTTAAQRIADGHYNERVSLPKNRREDELDELNQLAFRFNQMAEKLEQTETRRIQLIGDVAHELRTPLTTIKGSMEGLMDGVLPAEPETYQQIYREADRLQRLVEDLQELSRVEGGAYALAIRPVSPAQLTQAVVDRLGRQYAEKEVSLETVMPATLPDVAVDEDRIVQVLLNLVGNALQYTPRGGRVTLTAGMSGDEVEFQISDSGVGIPAEHLPHLFDRFYRVDKSRSRAGGGSGIGLTIAKHFVEAHGGRIWVESRGSGQGSLFRFTLPVSSPL